LHRRKYEYFNDRIIKITIITIIIIIVEYAIFMQLSRNMQLICIFIQISKNMQNKNFTIESTRKETSTLLLSKLV